MYQPLVPCPGCDRHVRTTDAACPFCAARLPADLARRAVPSAPQRLGRAAAFAFGASLAVTACGSQVTTGGASGSASGAGGSEATGAGGAGGSLPDCAAGGVAPLYGISPPPDPACDVDAGPPDSGGVMSDYGSPPPPPQP
jgi:hypothetical protein